MSHIEVLKQAIEALYYAEHNLSGHDSRKMFEAIASIRQAIADLENQSAERVEPIPTECRRDGRCQYAIDNGVEGLSLGFHKSRQDPVAMVVSTAPTRIWLDLGFDPSEEDEISFHDLADATWSDDNATGHGIEYVRADTSPPQRQWVGLSDVEWMNIVNKNQAWFGKRPDEVAHEVAKLVEAKLKEKNT